MGKCYLLSCCSNVCGPALYRTFVTPAQLSNSFDVLDFKVSMQLCTAYALCIKIHNRLAYYTFLLPQLKTLTFLFVLVNIHGTRYTTD